MDSSEINATQLAIGNWVRNKKTKELICIFEIDGNRNVINNEPDGYDSETNISIDDIEPIPLTAEILKQNGFKAKTINGVDRYMLNTDYYDFAIYEYSDTIFYSTYYDCEFGGPELASYVLYVHQFQQFMKISCGINKEIIL